MTTVEILEKAKTLVEKGWARGADVDSSAGLYCVATALWFVSADPEAFARAKDAARDAIGIRGLIAFWNDAPGRTQAEVVAAFTKAIELAGGTP